MKFAAILIRGPHDIRKDIKDTLYFLKLRKKNALVIVPDTPVFKGMLMKVKDYITWGEIDDETLALLKEKRGKTSKDEGTVFFLHPPRGGFERKGIKKSFKEKGALGFRKEKINDLIKRMI
jgi:large subunit ribosomal protein L30